MKGKILLITLVVAAVAMVIGTIVFFSLEEPLITEEELSAETAAPEPEVALVNGEVEEVEKVVEDFSFNLEIYEMYEELGYPTADEVPSLFHDVAAAAHANGQFTEIDTVEISEDDYVAVVTVPKDSFDGSCGFYGVGLCMMIRVNDEGFEILKIMDSYSGRGVDIDDQPKNYSSANWILDGLSSDGENVVFFGGWGDAGHGSGAGYTLNLETLKESEIGSYEVEPEQPWTITVEDLSAGFTLSTDDERPTKDTYNWNVEIYVDGDPRKEEVFEAGSVGNSIDMNWLEMYENPGEIWFTLVNTRQYQVTADGELVVTEL